MMLKFIDLFCMYKGQISCEYDNDFTPFCTRNSKKIRGGSEVVNPWKSERRILIEYFHNTETVLKGSTINQ